MITIQHSEVASGEIWSHKLTHIDCESSVLEASKLMRKTGTTRLLVTDRSKGLLHPLGMMTANDIVTRVMGAGLDPAVMTSGDIAESGLSSADTIGDEAAIFWRSGNGNEALAVLDGEGRLVGVMKLDDLKGMLFHQPGIA